jgi:hypothetical protein
LRNAGVLPACNNAELYGERIWKGLALCAARSHIVAVR